MATKKYDTLNWLVFILIVIGALNWGLIGFFGYNVVEAILGVGLITTIIYDAVGLAALYELYCRFLKK